MNNAVVTHLRKAGPRIMSHVYIAILGIWVIRG